MTKPEERQRIFDLAVAAPDWQRREVLAIEVLEPDNPAHERRLTALEEQFAACDG